MTGTCEYRLIMAGLTVLCVLAAASAVWPVIDVVMTAGLLGALALGVAGYWGRELLRECRFRAEMRALDARDADPAALAAARVAAPRGVGASR